MADVPFPLGSRTVHVPQLPALATLNWLLQKICQYCQSQSYVTTDSQCSSLSWCQPAFWAQDQIFVTVRHFRVCCCGAPSLMRGRVCRLQLLLVLASAVILGSDSRGTHDHILLFQIQYSPNLEGQVPVFIPQEQGGRVIPPRHWDGRSVGWLNCCWLSPTPSFLASVSSRSMTSSWSSLYNLGTDRTENTFQQLFCCCVRICCGNHVTAAEPLPT
jgi:hypothetical protein